MLRRCNEWETVSGDPGNLRGLYSCLFSFKMRVSEVMKLYNTTINKILKMNWLGLSMVWGLLSYRDSNSRNRPPNLRYEDGPTPLGKMCI